LPVQTSVDESAVKVGEADDDMSDGSTCTLPYSSPCGVGDGVSPVAVVLVVVELGKELLTTAWPVIRTRTDPRIQS
jgi:hypothetical protein